MYKQTECWNVSGSVGVVSRVCTSRLNAGMCQGGWEWLAAGYVQAD